MVIYSHYLLLLFTDGILEAQNSSGNLFGYQRLVEILNTYQKDDAKSLAYKILEEVQKFSVDAIYSDDSTVVVIKRERSQAPQKIEYTIPTDKINMIPD